MPLPFTVSWHIIDVSHSFYFKTALHSRHGAMECFSALYRQFLHTQEITSGLLCLTQEPCAQCTYHKLFGQPENKVLSQCSATACWASATRLSPSEATSVQDSLQVQLESHQSNFVDDLAFMFIMQLVACGPAWVSDLDGCTQMYRQSNSLAPQLEFCRTQCHCICTNC